LICSLDQQRTALMAECGLDAYAQKPEIWLNMAVGAEERGAKVMQRDYERAMTLAEAKRKERCREPI
jgi:hypothetical protein